MSRYIQQRGTLEERVMGTVPCAVPILATILGCITLGTAGDPAIVITPLRSA
jgi:hypothetical protein